MSKTRASESRTSQGRAAERHRSRASRENNPFLRSDSSIFPETPTDDEFSYLWVRTHTLGAADSSNVRAQLSGRLAYTPVLASELPGVASLVAVSSMGSAEAGEHIHVGDCMLCRIPKEMQEMYVDAMMYLSEESLAGIRSRALDTGAHIEKDEFEK